MWQNLTSIQTSVVDVLASQVEVVCAGTGIPDFVSATPDGVDSKEDRAIMGFTGKNLEAAEFLLADADEDTNEARAGTEKSVSPSSILSFVCE